MPGSSLPQPPLLVGGPVRRQGRHVGREYESPAGEGNQITTYDYDAAGLVNLVNGPPAANDTTTYVNDARSGKPSTVTAPNAQVTTVAYDGLGRTTAVTLPGATAVSLKFDYRLGSGPQARADVVAVSLGGAGVAVAGEVGDVEKVVELVADERHERVS